MGLGLAWALTLHYLIEIRGDAQRAMGLLANAGIQNIASGEAVRERVDRPRCLRLRREGPGVGGACSSSANWQTHGRGSGVDVYNRLYLVFTMRAGKVVRVEVFGDEQEAVEAAGLRE